MRSYPVKENPISSAVSEILWYRHTDLQTNKHPVTYLKILSTPHDTNLGVEGKYCVLLRNHMEQIFDFIRWVPCQTLDTSNSIWNKCQTNKQQTGQTLVRQIIDATNPQTMTYARIFNFATNSRIFIVTNTLESKLFTCEKRKRQALLI